MDLWRIFALSLETLHLEPTQIAEFIPYPIPATLGTCDAAGVGMGGNHFIPAINGSVVLILWRQKFLEWVHRDLEGSINNSDLELTGSITHNEVLAQHANVREHIIHNSNDNIATVFWQQKGSMTTTGPAAYLLQLQAFHQRFFRYVLLNDFIIGSSNTMANILSCCWDLSDNQFLVFFNSHFPQEGPWQNCPLRPPIFSALTLALSKRRSSPVLM